MEFIKVIYKCAFVVALIVSHEIIAVQGRQLRQKNKLSSSSGDTTAEQKHGVEAFRPGKGGDSPPTKTHDNEVGFSNEKSSNSGALHDKDAFRPAPKSPGIGHSYANENEQVVVESRPQNSNGTHYVAGDREDFRPTSPGHSPGVGHGTGKN